MMEALPEKEGMNQRMDTKYAPELNDIETVWRDLKAHYLAHRTFDDIQDLNHQIHAAVQSLNTQRMTVPLAKSRISA